MNELLSDLLIAVITAAVPVLTAFAIAYIKRVAANVAAETDDVKAQGYITEIADAVSAAVAATSQTYVDALKQAGKFDLEAQKEAAQKALTACLASISPAAQAFIEALYGDLTEYLTTKIEAEVRRQKIALPSSTGGATEVAASTAAATAATIAVSQLNAETKQAKSPPMQDCSCMGGLFLFLR